MKITKENIDDLNAVIKVLIEKSDYEKNVADKLKDYRKKATLPGFRPGFVPAQLIQKRFGKSILAEEVNQLLSQNLYGYFREQNLSILGEPLPNETIQKPIEWDTDQDFEFVFDIAMAPHVEIVIDKTKVFPYYRIKVTDEMINSQIDNLLNQLGTNVPAEEIKEKSLVKGDFVQLDDSGNEIPGGICPAGVSLATDLINDELVRSGFLGKKAGDSIIFDPVTAFGNRHEVGHMLNISHEEAEKLNSQFRFTILEVMDFIPAEINEELFKKIYGENIELKTIDDFRLKISEEIASSLAYSSDQKFAIDTRTKLLSENNFNLPETFLKRWLKVSGKDVSDEEIEKDFSPFLTDLHWQLIKNSITHANNIVVEEEEVKDFAWQMARAQYNQHGIYEVADEHLERLARMILEKEDEKEKIYRRISENKVIQVVKNQAEIEFLEVTREEFAEMMK
jgi:trigger factor